MDVELNLQTFFAAEKNKKCKVLAVLLENSFENVCVFILGEFR